MRIWLPALTAILLIGVLSSAQKHSDSYQVQKVWSPDGKIVALIRSSKATEATSESRVELRSQSGEILARRDYTSQDGEHGYGVTKAAWTPDSQFFVYSVESSGGHQSWHTPVLFFSRTFNKIVRLDDLLKDAVSNPQFEISAPDHVTVELWFSKQTRTIALHEFRGDRLITQGASKGCTSREAAEAEENTDRLSNWNDVHKSFSRFSQCDDGAIAEGYSDAITKLLAEKWNQSPELVRLSASDQRFQAFVLHHIDETVPAERLVKVVENASRKCPPDATDLCKLIVRAASR